MRRLALVGLVAGCGGNGAGDGGDGVDAALRPRVSFTVPDDEEVGVPPNYPIVAGFSAEMEASTINSSTFVIMEGTNPVPGTVTYDAEDHNARFTPDHRLALLGDYEVIITTGATSASGLRLREEHRWSFEVRDGEWSTPSSVNLQERSADHPNVALDAHGNALAVWNQYIFDPAPDVRAGAYTAGAGWRPAISLDDSTTGVAGNPVVAYDGDGVATVAFRDPTPGSRPVARRRLPDGTWEPPATLDDVDGDVVGLQLTVDAADVVTAVWSAGTDVLANRYVPGSGWSANATPLDNVDGDAGAQPGIGTDRAGNAIAVWSQFDGALDSVYWNRADAAGLWGTAALLETDDSAAAATVHLAVAPDGRAVAVYWLTSSGGSQFYARVFDGITWGITTPLPGGIGGRGSLAWAPDGSAWFVYESIFDGGWRDIVLRTFSAANGWSAPMALETTESQDAVQPQLAFDPNGNAIVVWRDGADVWSNRYVAGEGWRIATAIQPNDLRRADEPAISVGPRGEAAVVWELFSNSSNSTNIYASVFR